MHGSTISISGRAGMSLMAVRGGRERLRWSCSRSQDRSRGDPSLIPRDLLAVAALAAQYFDEAAGAVHGHTLGAGLDDLSDLLAAYRAERRGGDLPRVEDLQLLAVHRRPRPRRRVATADDVVGRVDMLRPAEAGFRVAHPALVG